MVLASWYSGIAVSTNDLITMKPEAIFTLVVSVFIVLAMRLYQNLYQNGIIGKYAETSVDGYMGLIGNTPMIEIKSLSSATGCRSDHTPYFV